MTSEMNCLSGGGGDGAFRYGTATANSEKTSENSYAYKAFQQTPQIGNYDCWSDDRSGTSVESWIQIAYTSPLIHNKVGLMPRQNFVYAYPKTFEVEGYLNGNKVFTSQTFSTTLPTDLTIQSFSFANNTACDTYKLVIHGCWQDRISIGRVLFTRE